MSTSEDTLQLVPSQFAVLRIAELTCEPGASIALMVRFLTTVDLRSVA